MHTGNFAIQMRKIATFGALCLFAGLYATRLSLVDAALLFGLGSGAGLLAAHVLAQLPLPSMGEPRLHIVRIPAGSQIVPCLTEWCKAQGALLFTRDGQHFLRRGDVLEPISVEQA
jgi:hypothetical protein